MLQQISRNANTLVSPRNNETSYFGCSSPAKLFNTNETSSQYQASESPSLVLNNKYKEEEKSEREDFQTILAKFRQENMILEAEKSSLQAELQFFKNELAKMCLMTNTKFPVFHQMNNNSQSGIIPQVFHMNKKREPFEQIKSNENEQESGSPA